MECGIRISYLLNAIQVSIILIQVSEPGKTKDLVIPAIQNTGKWKLKNINALIKDFNEWLPIT